MEQNYEVKEIFKVNTLRTSAGKTYELSRPIEIRYTQDINSDVDNYYVDCQELDIWGNSINSKEEAMSRLADDFHFCVSNIGDVASGFYGTHLVDKTKLFKELAKL
jgi:hypothetical protein